MNFDKFFNNNARFPVVYANTDLESPKEVERMCKAVSRNCLDGWSSSIIYTKRVKLLSALLLAVQQTSLTVGRNGYLNKLMRDAKDIGVITNVEWPEDETPEEYLKGLLINFK